MNLVDSFQNRLKHAMEINNMKQVDLVEKSGLDKTLINKYLAGISNARQKNLTVLADVLNVNEVWLMGYDVPMEREMNDNDTLKNVRMASYNGVDIDGLSDKEIEEIKQFVEFVRNKNKK